MKVFDTYTRHQEEIIPYKQGRIGMYVCGITPYDDMHIGHARCYCIFDTLRRYLIHRGYKVVYIQNYTDVDDKIIKRAREEGTGTKEVSERYIEKYRIFRDKLNILNPDFEPRVTENITDIIEFIKLIIENNKAYIRNGNVYISIKPEDTNYGRLSNKNLAELRMGARVEIDEARRNPLDFVLWKVKKSNDEPSWNSPWSEGRPGWHIECSVMSIKYLGLPGSASGGIDIHGGGQDLIFPHHENEIIQSVYAYNLNPVKYWVHNGFVTVKQEKMSKSLKNFFTVEDIINLYPAYCLRLFLLYSHYSRPVEFGLNNLEELHKAINGLKNVIEYLFFVLEKSEHQAEFMLDEVLIDKINSMLDKDFNTENAIAEIFSQKPVIDELIREKKLTKSKQIIETVLYLLDKIFGIKLNIKQRFEIPEEIKELLAEREIARKNKDFKKADELRKRIVNAGFIIKDTVYGQMWKKI